MRTTSPITALNAEQLRSFCKQAEFSFTTTDELPDFEGLLGQNRATEALSFAIEMDQPGYNMFLMGAAGLGKHSLLKRFLDKTSQQQAVADDWCYVYNFEDPQKPCAINFAAGHGSLFRDEMRRLLLKLDSILPTGFEDEKNIDEVKATLASLVAELKGKYSENSNVVKYFSNLEKNIISSLNIFSGAGNSNILYEEFIDFLSFQHFDVNLIVEHSSTSHAPVVFENNPSMQNLFGQVEYTSQMGAFATDYRYITPGALHKANGGYLVIDADKLLQQSDTWDAFKRTLFSQAIEVSPLDTKQGNVNPVSLQPEAVPLKLKVILVGSRSLYNALVEQDDEFSELFKVEVDFSATMANTKTALNEYAQVIATLIRKNKLNAFDKEAVECVIEYGMRQIEDTTLLSIHMQSTLDLLFEANYWAKKNIDYNNIVQCKDVQLAIDKQIYRADRSRSQIYDEINKGIIRINVRGMKVATVNGLFVIETGRLEFAQPARITANVRIGDGDIIDIEREVELGGSLHSKGVLILSSYLGANYATTKPLSLSASLVFEQSYGSVDGDSATVGELCALLSAISEIPVKQSFAITGSADQHGNVQAIGGVNEKIEGFFDICAQQGLTGEQAVIIPASNVAHLILRNDVIEAIENKRFFIYPVDNVNEAIALLTGVDAGERNQDGEFPEGTVNFKVEQRLFEMAELKHDDHNKDDDKHDDKDKDEPNDKDEQKGK